MKRLLVAAIAGAVFLGSAAIATAQTTVVPGQAGKHDANNNGWADAGVVVSGHYTSLYAYDGSGAWYWDLGDGRVYGSVSNPGQLDQATSTSCEYVNNYRGTFEDNAFMDTGWIQNHINCSGVDQGTYQYLIVHKTDPRYTGNPDYAIWGEWEYFVLVESGSGNIIRKLPRP